MGKTILIIDDDPVMVQMLSKRLQEAGFSVCDSADGMAGLEEARRLRPDLIILDVMLPGLNGFSVCGFLRSDPVLQDLPLIMITSRREECDQKFDGPFCPDVFLHKPFEVDQMFEKIQELI